MSSFFVQRRAAQKAERDENGCPCGSKEPISTSVTFVELHEKERQVVWPHASVEKMVVPGRSTTVYLCEGCGTVVFDFLAQSGFLAKAKFYDPEAKSDSIRKGKKP